MSVTAVADARFPICSRSLLPRRSNVSTMSSSLDSSRSGGIESSRSRRRVRSRSPGSSYAVSFASPALSSIRSASTVISRWPWTGVTRRWSPASTITFGLARRGGAAAPPCARAASAACSPDGGLMSIVSASSTVSRTGTRDAAISPAFAFCACSSGCGVTPAVAGAAIVPGAASVPGAAAPAPVTGA